MLYREFYKKYVIKHSTGFLNPKITLGKDFQLPRMSTLHYITDNLSVTTPHETLPYFNQIKPIIYPVLEYKHTDAGHPKILNREAKIYNELKKSSKFKYVPYNSKTLTVKNRDLLVYNYGGLVSNYRYNPSPMNPYYRYKNLMTTVCERIKDIGREHYININIPDEIVNRQTLDRYVTGVTTQTLKLFNNMGLLILLDLWRLLNPDFRETSSFYHIKTDMYEKVHFIFNHNNRLVVVNLKQLLGLVAEYKIKISDTPMSDSMVRKLLLSLYIQLSQVNLTIDLKGSGITEDTLNNLTDVTVDDVLDNFKYKRDKDIDDSSEEEDTEDSLKDTPVLDVSILNKVEYKNTKAVLEEKLDKFNPDKEKLDRLLKEGGISKLDYNKAIATIDKQNDDVSPYDSGVKLKEFLKYTKDEFEIKEEEVAVPEAVTSFDKTQLKDTQSVRIKKYIKETYKKDLVNTIYSLQKDNVYIEEYVVEEDESILGTTEIHTIRLKPINGKSSTIRIRLPKIEEDGTYKMSGNTYLMRAQRADKPLRKIDSLSVALSSYYGKSFITKATYKKDDIGMWFQKSLLKASETNSKIKNLVLVGSKHADVKLPTQYTTIARYTKSFTLGDRHYYFGYNDRKDLVGKLELSKVEGSKYIVVGREGNTPIVIDFNNKWYKYINGRYVEIDNLYTQLELDVSKMPLEFSNIKIFKQYIPVGVLMAYYLGFSSLIKTLGAKHRVLDKREKVVLEEYEYVITFKDVRYVLDKREELNTIILGGLASVNKILKGIERGKLDNRTDFTLLLEKIISERLPIYINEFNMLETMFVDDITAHVLEEMKEPTTFKGLLIRGSELLLTEYYPHPNSIEGSVIKGYERIPGMVYTELIKSLREYKQKSQFMRAKIDMSPYAVWGTVGDDSTTMLIDDLNPMATLKQFEDLTYTGAGGRTATTMNKASRAWHPSEIGIISEGSKDSGDVGVTAYMSANPKIKNTRGFVDKFNYKQDGWASIVTTNANMMAESIKDDPKRSNFGNIQSSHVIPINNGESPYIRTGYDSVFTYRVSDKFCYVAKQDGVVKDVNKNKIVLEFKDKTTKIIKLGNWSSKEESGSCYKHTVVTNLTKSDKFKHGDTITYDSTMFEIDMFDKTKVVYKPYRFIKMAMVETISTWEDSSAIHKRLSNDIGTTLYKVKSFILDVTTNLLDIVNVGDKVNVDTRLYTISASDVNTSKLDSKSLEILQRLGMNSPKAKYNGIVDKIEVRYHAELEDCSESIQELIKRSDNELAKSTGKKHITGRVDNQYSINGKPLNYGELEVKFYIEVKVGLEPGDKFVFGLQLKNTVGELIDYNITTAKTKEDIDAMFSRRSVSARIVTSPDIQGTTNTLLKQLGKNVVKMYKG